MSRLATLKKAKIFDGLRRVRRRLRGLPPAGEDLRSRIARSGVYWDQWTEGTPGDEPDYWLEIPAVMQQVSHRMRPGATSHYIDLFFDFLESEREQAPARVLSVGCGTGGLERGIAARFEGCSVHGIDVSRKSIEHATSRAREAGLDRLTYEEIDGVSCLERLQPDELLDGIFCHGVLHHMDDLESFFALARERLRPDGFLYVFEFVGPSRNEWNDANLCWAQGLFEGVPLEHRRLGSIWPPLATEDPTEMIRSSEIEPLLEQWFAVDQYWGLGGNVVVPLLASIKKGSFRDPVVHAVIQNALDFETFLMDREIIRSHFSAYYCSPTITA